MLGLGEPVGPLLREEAIVLGLLVGVVIVVCGIWVLVLGIGCWLVGGGLLAW